MIQFLHVQLQATVYARETVQLGWGWAHTVGDKPRVTTFVPLSDSWVMHWHALHPAENILSQDKEDLLWTPQAIL